MPHRPLRSIPSARALCARPHRDARCRWPCPRVARALRRGRDRCDRSDARTQRTPGTAYRTLDRGCRSARSRAIASRLHEAAPGVRDSARRGPAARRRCARRARIGRCGPRSTGRTFDSDRVGIVRCIHEPAPPVPGRRGSPPRCAAPHARAGESNTNHRAPARASSPVIATWRHTRARTRAWPSPRPNSARVLRGAAPRSRRARC